MEQIELLDENRTEKTTTEMRVVALPFIPEHEFFVRIKDFEHQILVWIFVGLISIAGSLIL